jgi:two-component system chemotaxis sensor kinase CheA
MPVTRPASVDASLDEVASAVLVAVSGDPSLPGALAPLLEDLAAGLDGEGDADNALLVRSRAARIAPMPSLPPAAIEAMTRLVGELQKARRGRAPVPPPATSWDAETIETIGEFLEEGDEGLAKADEILLAAESEGMDRERVNALFRVFHSIKGVAGFLELAEITALAHTTETLLNLAREGTPLVGANLDAIFEATARMRALLDAVRKAVETGRALAPTDGVEGTIAQIQSRIDAAQSGESASAVAAAPPAPTVDVAAPAAPAPVVSAPVALAAAPAAVAAPVAAADEEEEEMRPAAAARTPEGGSSAAGGTRLRETLKVDLERVDTLVEMIGELIIVESMVVYAPEIAALPSVHIRNNLSQLSKISRDLQDVAMRMRMVPVKGVFSKMARLVRELSRKTGKSVAMVQAGESTEMDRSMVERLEEPLVHMIRNAMDHAIEPAAERAAAGKPAEATIRLSAFHEGGSIVVELADDGRGLIREKILSRAVDKGLVPRNVQLSDGEVHALIFAPGFSTAAQVTELSGRGVGMDVVKRNIEEMRGRVSIASTPGVGTTFRLVLPLTLAIIDGMLVACGAERYIIPSLSILESLQPRPGMITTMAGADELISVRGEVLPLFRLASLFGISDAESDPPRALVVVVESMGHKVGLLVDEVVAQQQVVIKPIGAGIGQHEMFSGAAILSDGRVGLILNIDRICSTVARRAYRSGWDAQASGGRT